MILRQFLHSDPVAASYLFGCGGKASGAVVDPVGDIAPYLQAAEALGMRILYVIDTHLHADHISSARALAAASGAEYVLFAFAAADFLSKACRMATCWNLAMSWSRFCTRRATHPNTFVWS